MSEPISTDAFNGFYTAMRQKLLAEIFTRPPLYFGSRDGRARLAALQAEPDIRLAGELTATQQEWQQLYESSGDNPPILRVLEIHQPERQNSRIGCSECCESDCDDTVAVEWPCTTYTAIRGPR